MEVLSGINAMIAMSSPKTNEITPKNFEISKKVMMPRIMNVTPPMNPPNGSTGSSVFLSLLLLFAAALRIAYHCGENFGGYIKYFSFMEIFIVLYMFFCLSNFLVGG